MSFVMSFMRDVQATVLAILPYDVAEDDISVRTRPSRPSSSTPNPNLHVLTNRDRDRVWCR